MTALTATPAPPRPAVRLIDRPWGLYAAIVFVAVLALAAIAPHLLATHDPLSLDYPRSLHPPSWANWFGTDESGRDLYSRVVFGGRESLLIGLGAASVGIVIALVLGSLAALAITPVALVVDRFVEVLFTFPAERYERRSVVITSNLVFSEWDRIFKNPMTTAAAIDRLVHHSVILEFTGPSFRSDKAKTDKATGTDKPAKAKAK